MAAKVVTSVSKKIPIAGLDFSSVSASCTVEAEITDLAAVPAQARTLYAQAEAAVDEQLRLTAPAPPPPLSAPVQAPPASSYRPGPNPSPRASSPAPAGRGSRGMPSASVSQLKLIERLIDGDGRRAADICTQQGVRSLPELSIRAASTVIDALRAETPA